jgi:hypothetical protein
MRNIFLPKCLKPLYVITAGSTVGLIPWATACCKILAAPFLNGCISFLFKQVPSIKINSTPPFFNTSTLASKLF